MKIKELIKDIDEAIIKLKEPVKQEAWINGKQFFFNTADELEQIVFKEYGI